MSTHVLDAAAGRPAAGVGVVLERRDGEGWEEIAARVTDADGRIADLAASTPPGTYRLRFDVEAYAGPDCFYPEVVVTFRVAGPPRHRHVPLLLSPFSYSTYLGS